MYVDGHEQADVVAYRTQLLERMRIYEPFMPEFAGPEMESEILPARDAIILVTHGEAHLPPIMARRSYGFLMANSHCGRRGLESIHVSEFLTDVAKSIILQFFAHYFDQEVTFSVLFNGVD